MRQIVKRLILAGFAAGMAYSSALGASDVDYAMAPYSSMGYDITVSTSGTFIKTTDQLAFPGLTLDDIRNCDFFAHFTGSSTDANEKGLRAAQNVLKYEPGGKVEKMLFSVNTKGNTYVKGVVVVLTDGTGGVHAKVQDTSCARYLQGGNIDTLFAQFSGTANVTYNHNETTFATSDTGNGYAIRGLTVTRFIPSTGMVLAFEGASVNDIRNHAFTGQSCGQGIASGYMTGYNSTVTEKDGDVAKKLRVEMQMLDGTTLKCVILEFTDGDEGVLVTPVTAIYKADAQPGHKFVKAEGGYDGATVPIADNYSATVGYGVYNLSAQAPRTGATWIGGVGDVDDPNCWEIRDSSGKIISGTIPDGHTRVMLGGALAFDVTADKAFRCESITLSDDVTLLGDCDWSALPVSPDFGGNKIDIAGHSLRLATCLPGTVTDSTTDTDNPGRVVVEVAEGETLENTQMVLGGNLQLVKEGAGTFIGRVKKQTYTGGTVVNAGMIQSYATEADMYYGANGSMVLVNPNGAINIAGKLGWYRHQIVLNGGAIRNTANQTSFSSSSIGNITLTADSRFELANHLLINYTGSVVDLGGHTLSVTHVAGTTDAQLAFNKSAVRNGTLDMGVDIRFYPYNGVPDLTDVTVIAAGSLHINKDFSVSNFVSNLSKADSQYTATAKMTVTGRFTPLSAYLHNTVLPDGATLDLNGRQSSWNINESLIPKQEITFAEGATITIDVSGRKLEPGTKLITWSAIPTGVTFKLDDETAKAGVELTVTDAGLCYGVVIEHAYWTNALGDGDTSKPGNWACTNNVGETVIGLPTEATTVHFAGNTLSVQVRNETRWGAIVFNGALASDCDWSGLKNAVFADSSWINLNGHEFILGGLGETTYSSIITNAEDGEPSKLVLKVDEGATCENTGIFITGNLTLVKRGLGTYTCRKSGQGYSGGTLIEEGAVVAADSEKSCYYGAKDTDITVGPLGTLDINGKYDWTTHRIVLDGGTLANLGGNLTTTTANGIGRLLLTADSRMLLKYHTLFNGSTAQTVDLGGHTLDVEFDAGSEETRAIVYIRNAKFVGGTMVLGEHIVLRHLSDFAGEGFSLVVNGDISPNQSALTIERLIDNSLGELTDGNKLTTVTRYFKPGTTCLHNTRLANGATLDLSDVVGEWSTEGTLVGQQVTFADGALITIDFGEVELNPGGRVIAWPAKPNGATFKALGRAAKLTVRADGLYYDGIARGLIILGP